MKIFFKRFFGAIRSGNPAAWMGICIKLISPITRLIDFLIPNAIPDDYNLPSVLIITSPPRSGSTVTFQTLTRLLPVRYVSNWHALFPKNVSKYLIKKNAFGKGLSGFKNYYGYTSSLNDVNEANHLFDALFKNKPSKEVLRKRFVKMISQISPDRGPVILKNVKYFTNMALLHQAVPELFFLRIRRGVLENIQSVLKGYYELGNFNPITESLKNKPHLSPQEFAVFQILEINAEIDREINEIETEKWKEITYEDFCKQTIKITREIASIIGIKECDIRIDQYTETLTSSISRKVSEADLDTIRTLLMKYKDNY